MFLVIVVSLVVLIVAIIVIRNGNSKKALLAKAEQGDVQAQFAVYQAYKAKGAKSGEAIQYLEKSAENGYVEAQVELGRKLVSGDGIGKDPTKAIVWFNKAVEQESADAHYYLGLCYKSGDGVQKSVEKAQENFEQAAKRGYGDAYYERGLLCLEQDGDETENRHAAINCWKEALEAGSKKLSEAIGFSEVDKDEKLRSDDDLIKVIKDCCLGLLALRYELTNYGGIYGSGDRYTSINVLENDNKVGEIKFGTYGPESYAGELDAHNFHEEYMKNNGVENGKLCHVIHLDNYCIMMKSIVPHTEKPPQWLMVCAQVFKRHKLRINLPKWVAECTDAVKYVNTAFQYAED